VERRRPARAGGPSSRGLTRRRCCAGSRPAVSSLPVSAGPACRDSSRGRRRAGAERLAPRVPRWEGRSVGRVSARGKLAPLAAVATKRDAPPPMHPPSAAERQARDGHLSARHGPCSNLGACSAVGSVDVIAQMLAARAVRAAIAAVERVLRSAAGEVVCEVLQGLNRSYGTTRSYVV